MNKRFDFEASDRAKEDGMFATALAIFKLSPAAFAAARRGGVSSLSIPISVATPLRVDRFVMRLWG